MGTGEGAEERAHTGHLASEGEPNRRINSVKGAEFAVPVYGAAGGAQDTHVRMHGRAEQTAETIGR